MAKQTIRTGTVADPTGDSLKNAFTKVNANFTELYIALGLDAGPLNIGAFEFTGSVMTTTDSSAIVIDQAVSVTSDLTVGGDIVPNITNGGNLGSAAKPWHSLYVSNSTIYIGGNSLGLDNNGNLAWNGSTIAHADGEFISLDALTDINLGSPQAGDVLSYQGGYWTAATVDKLKITDGVEFTLVGGPGVANPYVTFPEANGANVLVQGNEISVFGNEVGLSSAEDGVRLAANATATNGPRREWAFGTDGSLTLPGDIKSNSNINIDINLADSTLRRWQFGEDGLLTFPDGTNYSGNDIAVPSGGIPTAISNINSSLFWDDTVTSGLIPTGGSGVGLTVSVTNFASGYAGTITIDTPGTGYTDGDTITVTSGSASATFTISTSHTWTLNTNGRTTFPNGVVPAHSYGAAGDKEGMLVFDDTYIYYCTADYVNNSTNIWKRTAHGAGTW